MSESTIHAIWKEKNRRRHGETQFPETLLIRSLDKNMRNRFTTIQRGADKEYEGGMATWFSTKEN